MCTLIAIHRRVPGFPLVVAANRDEYFDRPAEGPRLRRTTRGWVVAPLDTRAGGTWLGVNSSGVFSGLTNLRNPNPDPTRKSRGLVVLEALQAGSAEEAISELSGLAEGAYNPFNCFVADAAHAFVVVYQEGPVVHELGPGVHVIGNAEAAGPLIPKVERISKLAHRAAARPAKEVLSALAEVCRDHGGEPRAQSTEVGNRHELRKSSESKESKETKETVDLSNDNGPNDPLSAACVHVADSYGTRSSLLLELSELPEQSRLLHADGPPCVEAYEDFSSLLHELRQTSRYGAAENLERNAS